MTKLTKNMKMKKVCKNDGVALVALLKQIERAPSYDMALVTQRSLKDATKALIYYAYTGQLNKALAIQSAISAECWDFAVCHQFPADAAEVIHEATWDWRNNYEEYYTTLVAGKICK